MKIGVISFAHTHAAMYATRLADMSGVEVRTADPDDPSRIPSHLIDTSVPSYEELYDWGPDGVIICTENSRHLDAVRQAADAGAHILCEKPLGLGLADAKAILAVCEAAGGRLSMALPMRFNTAFRGLLDLVQAGKLGEIQGCAGRNPGTMPATHRAWFVDAAQSGGGAITDHVAHVADLARAVIGHEAIEVYAQHNRLIHADSVDVETGGLVMVTFANGSVATIDCSWSRPSTYPTWGNMTLQVLGEHGMVTADAYRPVVSSYDDTAGKATEIVVGGDNSRAMLAEFVASIAEDRPMSPDGMDGYRVTEIVDAAYRSAELGQPVALPLV